MFVSACTAWLGGHLRDMGWVARRAARGPGREREMVVQSLKAAGAAVLAGRVARFGRTVALVTGRNVDARTLTRVVGDS